jgi:hypothetical protein
MKQWRKEVRGWHLMVTADQGGGVGIGWHKPVRYNGITLMLGPVLIDIQPPAPTWLSQQLQK